MFDPEMFLYDSDFDNPNGGFLNGPANAMSVDTSDRTYRSVHKALMSASGAQNSRGKRKRERTQNLLSASANLRSFLRSKSCNFLGKKFIHEIQIFHCISSKYLFYSNTFFGFECRYFKWQPKVEKMHNLIDKVQKIILSVCRALEFSPAQANQALTERLVRELAPV